MITRKNKGNHRLTSDSSLKNLKTNNEIFPDLQAPTSCKNSEQNVKKFESITILSDDELEDGEIRENQMTSYDNIIKESFFEIERSKQIFNNTPISLENEKNSLYYIDKTPDNSLIHKPFHDSQKRLSEEVIEIVDDSVLCIDVSDDSFEDKKITTSAISSKDFISLSPIANTTATEKVEHSKSRKQRQKERFRKYKKKKMVEKVLGLGLNKLLVKNTIINVSKSKSNQSQTPNVQESVQPSNSNSLLISNVQLPNNSVSSPIALEENTEATKNKRIILIDGSNVAFSFTTSSIGKRAMVNDNKDFSSEALKKVITYFEDKKFQVKAIVPEYRVRRDKSSNHDLMKEMHDNGKLITTPSKSYDDLILLESAVKLDAAILSNDLFRDVRKTRPEFKTVIENRQIRYNWVFGELILAADPNGRSGPKLDDILYKKN